MKSYNLKKMFFLFAGTVFAFSFFLFILAPQAEATIVEAGPPILGFNENLTVGGGAIVPLSKFILVGDGSTALTKVGVILRASSTVTAYGQITGIALYRESGTGHGFNPKEDTYITGTYIANPATSTLLLLQPTSYAVPSGNTEFYVVASTTAAANLVNNDAFDIVMQTNYASTSLGSTGTALQNNQNLKITLSRTVGVKISEVRNGSTGNDRDEFIELYNSNPYYIDIQTSGLALHTLAATGAATNRVLSFVFGRNIMSEHGFFLIGSAYNYSGSAALDATYDNSGANFLVENGGLAIATSTTAANATSTAIDRVAWGTHSPVTNCENADTTGTACATALLENGGSLERIASGYPDATSTAATMRTGGADQFKGNGVDRDDNSAEFVLQPAATSTNPQNIYSPNEFSFGGGMQDTSAPIVQGSYPSQGANGIPVDLSFIGFNFNKAIQSNTIISTSATTTVTLVQNGTLPSVTGNLCSSVSYNPNPTNWEPSAKCNITTGLSSNTTYVFEVGTSTVAGRIRDVAGNALDQDSYTAGNQSYRITFVTSATSQTMTNTTPPQVTGSAPFTGAFNIPSNITKIFITFSQTMDATTLNAGTVTLYSVASGARTGVSMAGATYSYNASTSVLTVNNFPSLSANTRYEIEIKGQGNSTPVRSANGVAMAASMHIIPFTTGASDGSVPQILGVMPLQSMSTNLPLNNVSFTAIFDDHIDASTATSGAVTLGIQGAALTPSAVSYDSVSKELSLTANNLLPANQTMILTVKGSSIKNISGTLMGTDYTKTFTTETTNSDETAPSISFVNADEFGIAITFNEAVNSTDATDLTKYSIVYTPSGGSQQTLTLSAMAGHTIAYNASKKTAKLTGIYLSPNASLTLTATNIRDITGNLMTSSSVSCTVMSSGTSGGMIDPGMGSMTGTPPPATTFTMTGGGNVFMPPANIMAMNTFVSASSTYGFEIPISKQIPANGQIVISFPSSSDFGLCCAATSSSAMRTLNDLNKDINGPGTGTIGIKTIAKDDAAKTITLTLDTATRSESSDTHDFLKFALTDIKNPSVAKGPDSSGYSLDIKTKSSDGTTILDSNFSVNPVYIGGGNYGNSATTTIKGRVLSGYGGSVGLNGVELSLMSPMLGAMPRTTTSAQSGATHGYYEFTNLPANNDYFIFTAPIVNPTNGNGTATTTGYFGFTEPSPIRATSTSLVTKNLTLTATTSAVSLIVKLTASASTFLAGEQVDVFAGGQGQFSVQTATLGTGAYSATTIATLSLPQQNGMWFVGIGPGMPKNGMMMGPPPSPAWAMPKPLEINMSGCPDACLLTYSGTPITTYTFSISRADKTISGIVKDESGTTIANTMVYAYSPSQMMGSQGQSDTAGKFSMSVVQGQYNVGAFYPGMGQSKEVSVEVDGSGNVYVNGSKIASTGQTGSNPFNLTIKRPSYTITGKVSDGTNSIANAPVFAYRTDGPGHSDAMTDSSGNYTLYVDNGAWKVNAHIPGYGSMSEQSVVISGANYSSSVDFAPSNTTSYWTITGTVFESADATIDSNEGISNVIVSAKRGANFYDTKTDPDGVYSLRVPEGNSYVLEAFKPGYGRIPSVGANLAAIGSFNVTGTTTKNIRVNTRQTVTINIKDADGNFMTVPEAFIDLFDMSKNFGNHAEIRNGTSTTLQIANMSSTTVRVFIPSVPQNTVSFLSDNGANTTFADSVNTILNVDGAEIVKVKVNTNLREITGTVYKTSAASGNELKDVWIEVVDTASGMHYGMSATTTAGTYSIKLADGTYSISAAKSGYTMTPQTLTVSANATQNLIMTSANLTISGTITAGGSAAQNSFVWAEKVGGGFAGTQADASGAYSLSVDSGTWRIYAASDKYKSSPYSGNPITISASQTGINIALTTASSIRDELVSSGTFKDTASGSFDNSTLNTKITVDSGSLGQSGSDSYITVNETTNYLDSPSVNVISDKAKDINAYSGGSQVKNLSSGKKATVELTYTVTELATEGIDTPTEVSKLQVSTINDQKQWQGLGTIPTYKDADGNAVSVATTSSSIPSNVTQITFTTTDASHFSAYALTEANNPSAPSQPSGFTATAAAAGTNQITLSWSASTGSPDGYYIYRNTSSGDTPPLLTNTSATTYTDTGLSFSTTYYYRIGAYRGTTESQASAEALATVQVAPGGGSPGVGASGGGGGAAPVIPPQTTSAATSTSSVASAVPATKEVQPATPATPSSKAKPSARALAVSSVFNKTFKIGSSGNDVKRLQQILNLDSDTIIAKSGPGSLGKETIKFGAATKNALQKFQEKYGIAKKGDTGYGVLGPATRAKIAEIFKQEAGAGQEVKKETKAKTTLKKKTAKTKTILKKKTTVRKKVF